MKNFAIATKAAVCAAFILASSSSYASFLETFDNGGLPAGWVTNNQSTRANTGNPWSVAPAITDGGIDILVAPHSGSGMAIANYTSVGSGTGTISNWLLTPLISGMKNGDVFSFFTTTTPDSDYPDRLEFRLSSAGSGTSVGNSVNSVGTFSTLLLSINPTLAVGGYPEGWTQYSVTLSGLTAPIDGRVALRYFVTSGGPAGANSNIIGVDDFRYQQAATVDVPEPAGVSLVLAGVGLVAFMQRRRNRSSAT
jgi:hypothetical protein